MITPVGALEQANSLVNQVDIAGLPKRIAQAIKSAAARTGVDFSYLVKKAAQESSFNPNAKATTSSATGLFQFTNQTWLRMIKDHGAAHGLSQHADRIQIDNNGQARVSDPRWRETILALRKDPQISSMMAGELDKQNQAILKGNVGGKIGGTELYLAHFLGAGGASEFLNNLHKNPNAKAAALLPEAASANKSVFYDAGGHPRSLGQIYNRFAQKFDSSAEISVASVKPQTPLRSPLPSYEMASAEASYLPASNYVPQTFNSIKTDSSSLFATMVLAQMHMDDVTKLQGSISPSLHERNRHEVFGDSGTIS